MTRTHFEELKVYQLAETLADEIWNVVAKWEHFAKSTVGQQIVRSADGVGACLAEGSGRGTAQDNRRFIGMARGSLYETKHWLRRAFKRKLLTKPQTDELKGIMDNLTPALNGYWRSVSQAAARSRAKTKSKL
ncbi:MAG: four helix bundle protein [Acidobacteria bacterium]|nr:MAG: four helix bundle protein [Acidobacteriota bacterium]